MSLNPKQIASLDLNRDKEPERDMTLTLMVITAFTSMCIQKIRNGGDSEAGTTASSC